MKTISKQTKIVSVIVILALIILCAFNFTYSYFSANISVTGNAEFGNLQMYFAYETADGTHLFKDSLDASGKSTIKLDIANPISRGNSAILQYNNTDIEGLGLKSMSGSCDAYVRFWIDAYIDGDSTNYARYFDFEFYVPNSFERNTTNYVYYIATKVPAGSELFFTNTIKLDKNAPIKILGKTVNITVSFEAVQARNGAYKVLFNDAKGYSSHWE